jgi:hypothetical protein
MKIDASRRHRCPIQSAADPEIGLDDGLEIR